jgi:hypothetical protein
MTKRRPTSERSPEIAGAFDALDQLDAYIGAKAMKVKKIQERTEEDPEFNEEIPTGVAAPTQMKQPLTGVNTSTQIKQIDG